MHRLIASDTINLINFNLSPGVGGLVGGRNWLSPPPLLSWTTKELNVVVPLGVGTTLSSPGLVMMSLLILMAICLASVVQFMLSQVSLELTRDLYMALVAIFSTIEGNRAFISMEHKIGDPPWMGGSYQLLGAWEEVWG